MSDECTVGIVVESYSSLADAVTIIREITKETIIEIRDHICNHEFVKSCSNYDSAGLKQLVKYMDRFEKNGITIKIFLGEDVITKTQLNELATEYSRKFHQLVIAPEQLIEDVDMSSLQEFSYLWEEDKNESVVEINDTGFAILRIKENQDMQFLIIEDNDLSFQVAANMILQGNRVIDKRSMC